MNPVVHFEMPAENMQRIADFYSKLFGWQPQMMGEEMGNYVVVTTSEADDSGRPKMPGTINGGFYPKHEGKPLYCLKCRLKSDLSIRQNKLGFYVSLV